MNQAPEILNLDWHRRRLIVKALNRYKNNEDAAAALGITSRTLISEKRRLDIKMVRSVKYTTLAELESENAKTTRQ